MSEVTSVRKHRTVTVVTIRDVPNASCDAWVTALAMEAANEQHHRLFGTFAFFSEEDGVITATVHLYTD